MREMLVFPRRSSGVSAPLLTFIRSGSFDFPQRNLLRDAFGYGLCKVRTVAGSSVRLQATRADFTRYQHIYVYLSVTVTVVISISQ